MEDIIKEKISADHLLYVSLKYTKTCDVIINLIIRWRMMIERMIDAVLEHAKKKKKISSIPENPVKKIEELKKERTGEFRKNVTLKVFYRGEEINVNLEMLKIHAETLEKFISNMTQFLLK